MTIEAFAPCERNANIHQLGENVNSPLISTRNVPGVIGNLTFLLLNGIKTFYVFNRFRYAPFKVRWGENFLFSRTYRAAPKKLKNGTRNIHLKSPRVLSQPMSPGSIFKNEALEKPRYH